MHTLAYERKLEQEYRLLSPDNSAEWKAKAIEVGKLLQDQLGKRSYFELIDLMPNGKTWKYYYEFLRAALDDDNAKAYETRLLEVLERVP